MRQTFSSLVFGRLFVPVIFLLSTIAKVDAASPTAVLPEVMFEPLFGIEYKPAEVIFEPAPKAVFKCRDLRTPRRILFVFGKAAKDKSQFYYVFGLIEAEKFSRRKQRTPYEAENDDGIIAVISPEGCRDVGAGYALSSDQRDRQEAVKLGITDDVISALLADAVDREVKAFGGTEKFLSRVEAAGVNESMLHPQLQAKLATLRNRGLRGSPGHRTF